MTPTAEQQAILDRAPAGTVKVAAGAGCGKTSTLEEYGRRWSARGLYLAFNRSIAREAAGRFPPNIETRTAHSYAYRALDLGRRGNVVGKYRHEHLKPFAGDIEPVPGMTDARARGEILRTIDNFLIDEGSKIRGIHCPVADPGQNLAIRRNARIVVRKLLRFDSHDLPITHDTYLKTFELRHRIEGRYDYMLIDEAQDLNPVLISIAKKAGLPLVLVGDSFQSIYRFRGAVDAMDAFAVDELPLTHSWRFGEAVAVLANRVLRHSSRPVRYRLRGNPARETEILPWSGRVQLRPGTALLALTNARLFEGLVTLDRPFHLIGGIEDLRRQLLSAHALWSNNPHLVVDPGVARFRSWRALDDAAERGDYEARRLRDIVGAYGDRLPPLLDRLGSLYRERESDAPLLVSTAHRAKGREFETVVVLDDFEDPADLVARRQKDARWTDEADQQINLLYVACTRATRRLFLAPRLYEALC